MSRRLEGQVAVVTGKNLKMTTSTDIVTARDSMEWYDQKQVAVARGDAVAIRNDRMVKGDILTAYMKKTAPPASRKVGQPVWLRNAARKIFPGAAPLFVKGARHRL